jgi:GNAT superfamily N-acetyltransferase
MMGKKEEDVVPMMNDIYSKYGFSFRKTGIDNEMQVIADNGEKTFIELKPILKSDQIDSSRRLQKFLKDNAIPVTKEIAEVEKNEVKNAARALNLRKVGRLNDDGTESTVLMASGEVDGKYVAYPTLFPKDTEDYTSAASSWMELDGMDAIKEAKNRNELFYFDTEEEAQKFAEGSWKEFSNADAEADLFFEKKGLNYMSYKNNYDRFEYALDRSEFLKEAPRFEDELTEDEAKKYGDLYVNGTLRSDAGKIQEDLEKEADSLRDFVNDKDYLVTRYEFDSHMQEKYEKKAQIAVNTNNISKAQIEKVNDMSVEFFGVPLNELSKYQPKTNEEVDKINSIVEAYNEAMTTRQMAANQYDVANTYLNEKFEKSIRGEWLENGAAFNDAVKKAWYNGRAADAIMMESLGFTDITQSGMSWNDVSPEEVAQKIIDALSETETGKNSIVAQRFHSSKNFKDIWDTFKDDPAELALTMAAESMAQLLPMALKIVPTTTAIGVGVGAGIGATGFITGPTGIVTTTGGALTGGSQGFRTGMSAVSFAMEYTNAVLDAVRNSDKGYDIMNVDDLAAALQDEDIWREGREIGLKRGIPIAVVDYMTSGLAGRFLKVGSVASRTTKVAAGVGERFIYDPAAEALGEFTAQVVAGQDISLQEITAEALGGLGSKAPMAGINMYMDARNKTNVGIANDLADINFMANESSSDGAITKWANNMERLGHITAEQSQRIQENVAIRREARDLLNVGSGKVPMPFTASNKVQARTMELLAARDELTSTQNRRAVFGSKVAEINAELQELVTNKKLRPREKQTVLAGTGVTEASRQATGTDIREGIKTYNINDKAYTREEFLSRIADMSEKQLKKANVAVKNDDSVLDILRKKGKEIAQKVEETSVLRPKGDDEGVDLTAPTYEAPTQVTSPTAEAFATVNRNDGNGTVTLTEDEYNAEMEKFAPVEEAVAPSEQITQKRQEGLFDVETGTQPVTDNPALKDVESTAQAFKDAETSKVTSDIAEAFGFEVEQGVEEKIAKAYHKAKADGTNPELVKAVEQSLQTTVAKVKQEGQILKPIKYKGDVNGALYENLEKSNADEALAKVESGESQIGYDVIDGSKIDPDNALTKNMTFYIIHVDGDVIGIASLNKDEITRQSTEKGSIAGITIHEKFRGKGIAEAIYKNINETVFKETGETLKSDWDLSPDAIKMWDKFVEKGLAVKRTDLDVFQKKLGISESLMMGVRERGIYEMSPPPKTTSQSNKQAPDTATKEGKPLAEKPKKERAQKEKEFDSFKKIVDDMGYGSYEIDYLDENGNPVAYARGGKFNEFTTLEFIKIEDEYQGLGYSKFIYRDALEHANEQGSEGLMVGGQLLQESKSRATYKNFKNYEHSLKNERGNPYIVLTDFIKQQDAVQEPSTEEVDVQEPARDSKEVGEGNVRETTEEVDTEEQKAKIKQEADDLANALGLDDDVKFQLETDMTDKQRKETLEKEAEDLMNEVQPENVETVESVEAAEPIPVNLDEGAEPVKRTGIKRFRLKDIVGKKLNLLMADKLKIELMDPSKPYDQETNPYVKMGGNFFPLMEKIFGKAAWASIDKTAANKIIIGAMNGDLSVVYNMGDGGVDSNIAMAEALDNAIPENRKDEIFQLIKKRVLGSDEQKIKRAHKHFKNAKTLMEAFESLANTESIQKDGTMKKEGVDVRAAVTRLIIPTGTKGSRIDLHVKLKELGVTIEKLREENAEQFAKELPDGALTMVVEVQDENGVPVRERKLAIDKELADGKITDKEYEAKYNAIIDSARMSVEQQQQEGIPSHRNYPVYIRGRAVGIMEETASFFNVIPEYRQKINERVSGIDKKKTGEVKEGVTKVEESIYNQIKEAKKDSTSVDSKKEIIKELLKGNVKKLKNGEVKSQTISLLKSALKINNKASIKEILTKAETPFAETTQYSAGEMRSAAMSSAMGTSTTAYEVVEYLKDQHERFLGRLSKAFPTVDVVLSQNEFDAIIANAQAKKLVTANQKVYGAVYEGRLYLNPNLPNYNTPIHEFGHVWLNVARELGKDTYKKGMELMTKDSPYYQQVVNSKEYGKIIDKMRKDGVSEADIETYIKEEALATAIGDKGESFTSAAQNKNFKNWLNELFEFIGKLTGISELTPDQLQNITLDEFVQGVVVDLMSENEVFAGAEVKSFGEQLQLMTVPENSMTKIIEFGRAENFSDASIKEILKKRGFSVAEINKAMVVNIDMQTQLPLEFNRVKGGVTEASEMFNDVRDKLRTFAKGKRKKLPAKKLTVDEKRAKANELRQLNPSLFEISDDEILRKYPEPAQYEVISAPTISEVRAKAIELLREHPVFKKQSDAVQGAILVGFDKTIGTKANKKVQDVINAIKNKAKAMRQGVRDIKDAQSQLKSALKDMPMSNDIRRIIKAVGDVNQDNILAQLERITELVDNIRSKDAASAAQKNALQVKILELKKNAKDLATLKGQIRRFIGQSLPVSDTYTEGQMKKVNAIIDKINFDNQVEQVQKVLDIVEGQRSKMRNAVVKRMLDNAKKYAAKQRKGKLVAKAGSVEAQGQMFFEEAAKILKYAYNNDTESMLKLAQELSDLDGIDEIVQKEINGESLTQQEQALLDRVYAFDTFGDIMNMDLDDVMNLENAIADVKKESSIRLKNARLERSARYAKLSKESKNQIRKGFRELFSISGNLKTVNQLNQTSKAIYEEFKRNGTVAAVKRLVDDIGYSQYNPINFIKNMLMHMGTMSTILDKGGSFFTDNIVNPLKDANENFLRGYQNQTQRLDDLANAIKGIDGGYKQIRNLLKGKGMFIAGVDQSVDADIASIRAMVDENPTDPNTLANAKKLIAEVIVDRMKYLGMNKSDIKAQIKAINNTIDAKALIKEQVEFIDAISKLKQVDGVTLNKSQLLRVYALSKNDAQREKLKGQGFTGEVMAEIEQFLGPELIAFADNVVDYLSSEYYESVNDVHVRVNDINLDHIENYFPTMSIRSAKPTEYGADNFAKGFSQMSPSAISQRVDMKSGINLTQTFDGALQNHFQNMERYKAYAETVNTIHKILAFDHVNALLDRTGLKKMYYMTVDNDVNPSSESNVFFQWVANRFYGMTLGFKPIQIPKQATSFINAYEQYSFFKDGKKKKLGVLGPDLIGFAYDYVKVLAFFRSNLKTARLNSATFNQRVLDAYQGDVFGLESGPQATKEQRNEFIRWWNVASASPTTFGDILGVMGYMAVYNRNIANGMSPKEAIRIFNDYNDTQQSRRGTEASPIQVMARKQPLLRMMTMFSSTMLLQINKVYQSSVNVMRDISNKKVPSKRDIRSIYLNVGLANVLFVLAGNMMKLMDGDDEDKEEVYTEMKRAMIFMNQMKKLPIFGSAVASIEAFLDEKRALPSIQAPLDRLTYDIAKSIKDEDYTEVIKRVFDFAGSTNLDMFQGIIQGTTEGFEDEVIYDILGLPKSARPNGEKRKERKFRRKVYHKE